MPIVPLIRSMVVTVPVSACWASATEGMTISREPVRIRFASCIEISRFSERWAISRSGRIGSPVMTPGPNKRRVGFPLFQRNRQPTQIHIRHQPDLASRQFQHRALLLVQHARARATADREARARRAIDAGDIGGPV